MRSDSDVGPGDPAGERGVSEVIDEVLLVAIVVILAAIAGVFGLGLAENSQQAPPQASIGINDHADAYQAVAGTGVFALEHGSGSDLEAADTRIVVRDQSTGQLLVDLHAGNSFTHNDTNATLNGGTDSFVGETFSTGDTLRLNVDGGSPPFTAGETYEVLVIDTASDQLVAERTVRLA